MYDPFRRVPRSCRHQRKAGEQEEKEQIILEPPQGTPAGGVSPIRGLREVQITVIRAFSG